jgi:hypothetical protein
MSTRSVSYTSLNMLNFSYKEEVNKAFEGFLISEKHPNNLLKIERSLKAMQKLEA